jgi:hypothetical protein
MSMDATVRIAFHVRGQANYRESKEKRNEAAVPDESALRRVLGVRGRTGAVLVFRLVQSEESSVIAVTLTDSISESHRIQTVLLATDNPSHKLFDAMCAIFPNLRFLILDPIHLVIVYIQCFYHKRTAGSQVLRIIMNKFNKIDDTKEHSFWGPAYPSGETRGEDHLINVHRLMIMHGTMDRCVATRTIEKINPDTPWYKPLDFVKAIAALSTIYREEVDRKTYMAGKKLYAVLWSATAEDRMQWYFNGIRGRHFLPKPYLPLIASGTSSVESLNHEINTWFRNLNDVYAGTLKLALHINRTKKLLTHNIAMYTPQLRQLSQQTIAAASHSEDRICAADWTSWCTHRANGFATNAGLPNYKAIKDQQQIILLHEKNMKKRPAAVVIFKRPGAILPTAVAKRDKVGKRVIKRRPFNLKRTKTPKKTGR